MALTEQNIALRAMELLKLTEQDLPRLASLIPLAKHKLATDFNSELGNELLRASFNLTISSGQVNLSTALTDAEPLLLETIKWAEIFSASSSYKWQYVLNRSILALQTVNEFIHFTLEGTTIYTDATDTTATMTAGIEPSLATIEARDLDDELVLMVGMLAMPKVEQAA